MTPKSPKKWKFIPTKVLGSQITPKFMHFHGSRKKWKTSFPRTKKCRFTNHGKNKSSFTLRRAKIPIHASRKKDREPSMHFSTISLSMTAGESSVSILIDPIITALKPSTANTQQTPTLNIKNITESRTMKTWLTVSRNLHCRLWVLKYTRRSDLLVYTLDRSGFPNVNLGNLKWLDFWKRDLEFNEKFTTWGGSTLTDVGRNDY